MHSFSPNQEAFRINLTIFKKLHSLTIMFGITICAILLISLQCHTALANPLTDNSIHGGEQANHHPKIKNAKNSAKLAQHNLYPQETVNQNRCQSGWMWFNNKCWVTTQSRRDFVHAVDLCKSLYNSTLPTIHSEEENEFLKQNIDLLHNSPIWLYAQHNHQYNKTHWLDKSKVNYTKWDDGQPNDKSSLVCIKTDDSWYMKKAEPVNGQTECVSFWEDAKWGTQVGCLVLLPVVCEKKLTPINRLMADATNSSMSISYEQQSYVLSGTSSLTSTEIGKMVTILMGTAWIAQYFSVKYF